MPQATGIWSIPYGSLFLQKSIQAFHQANFLAASSSTSINLSVFFGLSNYSIYSLAISPIFLHLPSKE